MKNFVSGSTTFSKKLNAPSNGTLKHSFNFDDVKANFNEAQMNCNAVEINFSAAKRSCNAVELHVGCVKNNVNVLSYKHTFNHVKRDLHDSNPVI